MHVPRQQGVKATGDETKNLLLLHPYEEEEDKTR